MSRINPFPIRRQASEVFAFSSTIMAGTDYTGGFYVFGSTSDDFSTPTSVGPANVGHGGSFFIVTGAVPANEVTITITGTSAMDAVGPVVLSNSVTITIPADTPINTYFETEEKWIGQIEMEVTSGTPITCNYGLARYWTNLNRDFTIIGIEATWMGGANDPLADLHLIHHKATGWTYTAGEPVPPAPIFSHKTDYGVAAATANDIEGAWKRTELTTFIEATGGEGIFIGVTSGVQRSFDMGILTIWLVS